MPGVPGTHLSSQQVQGFKIQTVADNPALSPDQAVAQESVAPRALQITLPRAQTDHALHQQVHHPPLEDIPHHGQPLLQEQEEHHLGTAGDHQVLPGTAAEREL